MSRSTRARFASRLTMAAVLAAPLVAESRILLRRGVGVGLVLASLSQLRVPAPVRTPAPVDGEEGDTTAFVEGMKKRWSSLFEVSDLGDGVTVVSLGADRCRRAMAIKMKDETFSGSPVEVLFEVAARLDSSLKPGCTMRPTETAPTTRAPARPRQEAAL